MEEINILDNIIDKDEEKRIYIELNKIDGLHEYLRAIMDKDIRLHFNCPKDQQDLTRGGFYRTEYFSKLLKKYSQ